MAVRNNRQTGGRFEALACSFLKRKGHKILERNFRRKYGEVDIISRQGRLIWFVEVKARKNKSKYPGYEAVDKKKAERLKRVIVPYAKNFPGCSFRVGIVSIEFFAQGEIYEFIPDAFEV